MLTASRAAPKPANWQGVAEGLSEAQKQLHQGEYGKAQNVLRDVLEFAPVEAKAWHLLGRALQSDGDHEAALDCFSTAATLYGNRVPGHERRPASIRLSKLLWEQGDRLGAQTMLDALMLEKPDAEELLELQAIWQEESA